MSKTQRFFIAAFTGTENPELKNRILGLFSNQTELLENTVGQLEKRGVDISELYLKGKRKNLPVTNSNVALEFNRDNHLIIYKDNMPYIKVDVKIMNDVNQILLDRIAE